MELTELIFSRTTVVCLAILGGLCSLLASWGQKNGSFPETRIVWLGKAAYVCMAVSIFLFIGAGLLGVGG